MRRQFNTPNSDPTNPAMSTLSHLTFDTKIYGLLMGYIYIYIYIYTHTLIYIYIYTHPIKRPYIYIYIYIYINHYSKFLPTRRICSVKTFGVTVLGLPTDKSSC